MASKKHKACTVIRDVRAGGAEAIVCDHRVTFFVSLGGGRWPAAGHGTLNALRKVQRLRGLSLPREAVSALITKIEEG